MRCRVMCQTFLVTTWSQHLSCDLWPWQNLPCFFVTTSILQGGQLSQSPQCQDPSPLSTGTGHCGLRGGSFPGLSV